MSIISFIIPTLNEAETIADCLLSLQAFRQRGHEVIVVDGGSRDDTVILTNSKVDIITAAPMGRARQLNHGVKQASGELLVFLHADTILPEDAERVLQQVTSGNQVWGRFDVQLTGTNRLFRVIEFFMNWRSRLSGIATGDQAIFVTRQLFERTGGFPEIALMEDIDFSRKLKTICRPVCLRQRVLTSSRRWEQNGIIKTVLHMWSLRLRHAFGTSPDKLLGDYE